MKPFKSFARLKRQVRDLAQRLCAAIASFVRRSIVQRFNPNQRRGRSRKVAGFVLPTAVMLLLVMSLVVGGILIRTFNRTKQATETRQRTEIFNDATPAVDRAKAKLEYMFTVDPRVPAGVPSEDLLRSIMLDSSDVEVPDGEEAPPDNVYTFPDEERLSIGGTNVNAWAFAVDDNGDGEFDDADGDGRPDTIVAYSVIWNTPSDIDELADQSDNAVSARANNFEVRQGPLSGDATSGCEPSDSDLNARIEAGWLRDPVSTSILRKNFQISAIAIPDSDLGTIATLELQQEREADRGNKWGAWFRNDLEIFPGPEFRWNGAMHTEGNLVIGHNARVDRFQGYLVSGPGSCLYKAGPGTSETTINVLTDDANNSESGNTFRGQMIIGRASNDVQTGGGYFHIWEDQSTAKTHLTAEGDVTITPDNDSVQALAAVSDLLLDPVLLFTQDRTENRSAEAARDAAWETSEFVDKGRIVNRSSRRPYIDDFYRADDRYGPNPGYAGRSSLLLSALGVKTGEPIDASRPELTQNIAPDGSDPLDLGFDGYWERRAWREGMRTIVGQRLELGGDPFSNVTDLSTIDPTKLTPNQPHQSLQRRSLRDPLAAVQATAIYHSDDGDNESSGAGAPPHAAIVSTVHPGTSETLKRSSTFEAPREPIPMKGALSAWFGGQFGDAGDEILFDFLAGRGTNGWEVNLKEDFFGAPAVTSALTRLANFAGDPDGAFPAKQDNFQHPYPAIAQWGDFSNLRRTLTNDIGSFADSSNKHTAAIALGALANQVAFLDGIDYEASATLLDSLDESLQALDNRICDLDNYSSVAGSIVADKLANDGVCPAENNGLRDGEVIYYPNEDLNHNGAIDEGEDFDGNGVLLPAVPTMVIYAPTTEATYTAIARVPPSPEAYISGLEARIDETGLSAADKASRQTVLQFGRFVLEKEQVERDRHFGFRSSRFGLDNLATTIDTAAPTAIGQYQYFVKYLFDEDYNGDLQLNSDTAGPNNDVDAVEIGQTAPNGTVARVGSLEVEDWDADGVLDLGEDFDRDGLQDLFFSEDLDGDGNLNDITFDDENGDPVFISEDFDGDGALDIFDDADDGGNRNFNADELYRFTPLSEDLDGSGTQSTNVDGTTLVNPATNVLGWDVSGNGNIVDNQNLNEDFNGNGQLDIFRHRGAIYRRGTILGVGCDFSSTSGNDYFGFGAPTDAESEARFIRLASSLCSTDAKYPSLYYLFPKDEHGYITSTVDLDGSGAFEAAVDTQLPYALTEDLNRNGRLDPGEDGYDLRAPATKLGVRENGVLDGEPIAYLSNANFDASAVAASDPDTYVASVNTATYEAVDLAALEQVALKPQALGTWSLPYVPVGANPPTECSNEASADRPNTNCNKYSLIYANLAGAEAGDSGYYRVAFKDSAFFDGREQFVTRALNLDMEMLTGKAANLVNDTIAGNTWITGGDSDPDVNKEGGIVFAFREDAVREDGVARPAGGVCTKFSDDGCSDENALIPQDPAVDPDNGISAKAVNFIPDPARRPHGFRVINGRDISRDKQGGFTEYGLTFISDNPTYISGNFNCHKTPGDDSCDNPIEEFNYTLSDKEDWGPTDFYDLRSNVDDQDARFADPEEDSWRYSEFLVDAITILSDNFCDGSIEDTFVGLPSGILATGLTELERSNNGTIQQVYGCLNSGVNATSFANQGIPIDKSVVVPSGSVTIANALWSREVPSDPASPVRISPNGQPTFIGLGISEYDGNYETIANRSERAYKEVTMTPSTDTQTVNAVMISGLVPSRQFQSYGGLHNFPRFLEFRRNKPISISGSFLNLKFSNQATGPYDQDAWEIADVPAESGQQPFNFAPLRTWGYDVALQLTRPGPVSSRLVTVGGARSEFYRELPASDPYVLNLRCASAPSIGGNPIDPRIDADECS